MEPGTLVAGRYRIVRHLGSGAMASVHLAQDTVLERPVAIKSVHTDPESEAGRRIRREARLGASLVHENLVVVYDTVAEGPALLLIMEYVDGETLADVLARGALEPSRALAILRPLASALDRVHGAGIVHRDVKPANVLLDRRGRVKLADLGVASSAESTQITRTGGLLGSGSYMAPEQFEPGRVGPAADIFALAAVAFEALTGRRAFRGGSFLEVMGQIRENDPPDAHAANGEVPQEVADVLRSGLARDPDARPFTATALVDELEAALRRGAPAVAEPPPPEPPAALPEPPPRREPAAAAVAGPARARPARRRGVAIGAALAAVAAVVLAVVLAGSGDDATPTGTNAARAQGTTPATTGAAAAKTTADTVAQPPPAMAAAPAAPAASTRTAAGAVRAFYERAAAQDLDGAWALAAPSLRSQLGPRSTFDGTFRTLRSISFGRLEQRSTGTGAATVSLATVATHTDHTDRCTGSARTTRASGGRWKVARLAVQCTTG